MREYSTEPRASRAPNHSILYTRVTYVEGGERTPRLEPRVPSTLFTVRQGYILGSKGVREFIKKKKTKVIGGVVWHSRTPRSPPPRANRQRRPPGSAGRRRSSCTAARAASGTFSPRSPTRRSPPRRPPRPSRRLWPSVAALPENSPWSLCKTMLATATCSLLFRLRFQEARR